jgi:hypothetical protein
MAKKIPFVDMTGKTFNSWTVLKRSPELHPTEVNWLCRCRCGKERVIVTSRLRLNKTKGCSRHCHPLEDKPWDDRDMRILGTPESRRAKFGALNGAI